MNIGINGLGRIGQLALRNIVERKDLTVVAINDLFPAEYLAYLLKYDSTHGKFNAKISHDNNQLIVNDKKIKVSCEKDPANIKWGDAGADYIIEASGGFLTQELARKHINCGAKKLLCLPHQKITPQCMLWV